MNHFKIGDKVRLSKLQYEKEKDDVKEALKKKGFVNFTDIFEVLYTALSYDTIKFKPAHGISEEYYYTRFFELADNKSIGFVIE